MKHYHLVSTCSLLSFPPIETENPKYGCLYKVKHIDLHLMENLYVFSPDNFTSIRKRNNYIITEFFYLENKKIIRCYVLCPIMKTPEDWVHVMDKLYMVPLTLDIPMIPGRTSCSPKGYAYHNGKNLYQFTINNEDFKTKETYAAMLCFPYKENSLIRSYFAFCKVKEEHLDLIDKEWAHEDDPVYLETADTDLKNRRKKFLHHLVVKPVIPSHGVDH